MERIFCLDVNYKDKKWRVFKTIEEIKHILSKVETAAKKLTKHSTPSTIEEKKLNSEKLRNSILAIKLQINNDDIEPEDEIYHFNRLTSDLNLLIRDLLTLKEMQVITDLNEFLEISHYTFNQQKKRKEGYIFKRTGGRHGNEDRCLYFCKYCRRLQKRWLMVTDDSVIYTTKSIDKKIHEVLMYKDEFRFFADEDSTGYPDGIRILTNTRDFFFHAGSIQKKTEWAESIREALDSCQWKKENNFYMSTFPPRHGNKAK